MAAIIMRGVGDIEVVHEFAEIAQRRLGQDVPMIIHQHKTVQDDAIGMQRNIILENGSTLISMTPLLRRTFLHGKSVA